VPALTVPVPGLLLTVQRATRAAYERGNFVEKPRRRTLTSPGLGDSGLRARHVLPSAPPSSSSRVREGMDDTVPRESAPTAPASVTKLSSRRPHASRGAVRVDDVGDVAVAIASKAAPSFAPKLLKTRGELTSAPIDSRDAFVISLIDGEMSVQAIVDIAGMPRADVGAILDRLVQLGIIALP
jgi:hypothetical protein